MSPRIAQLVSDIPNADPQGHACRACGSSSTGLLCASCEPVARREFLALGGEAIDGTGYDASVYEELASLEPTSFWFRGRSKLLRWAIGRYFADARSLLEVGCGSGYTLASVVPALRGETVAGVDVHPEGLRIARRRLGAALLFQLDARSLPFVEDFDLVCAFDVLEHIADDDSALRSFATAIRPGGGLIVTVPQHPWLWSADDAAHHQRRYTRKELVEKLRAAGLDAIRVTSFMSLLLPVMAAARRRAGTGAEFDFRREFGLPRIVDRSLEGIVTLERALVRAGVDLPAGGSLLAVARRTR